MDKGSYSHILKYTGLFGGVQGLTMFVNLVRNKLVAVILGPDGMGLISLFNSVVSLVSNTTNLGIATSAVKNISEAYERNDEQLLAHAIGVIRSWALLTALVGTALCAVLSPLFHHFTFSWGDHSLHFLLLSPIIGLTAITGVEIAILKGTHRLGRLAAISVYNAVAVTIISVFLYYWLKQRGIVPSLVLAALAQMLITIAYSYRLYPLGLPRDWSFVGEGSGMVKVGIAFVLAGIMGSGADLLIRSYLNVTGSLDSVGLYNAAFVMTITYAGIAFSGMESDFYPRLSAVNADVASCNTLVNRQIEVVLLMVAPFMVAFMVGMPVLIPMLYSSQFSEVVGMVQIAALANYFRALSMPVSYLPLAKGRSFSFLVQESFYDVEYVLLVCVGFYYFHLVGAGVALVVACLLECVFVFGYCYAKFGYRPTATVFSYLGAQLSVGIATLVLTLVADGWAYWVGGGLLWLVSMAISVGILRRKTRLWEKLTQGWLKR